MKKKDSNAGNVQEDEVEHWIAVDAYDGGVSENEESIKNNNSWIRVGDFKYKVAENGWDIIDEEEVTDEDGKDNFWDEIIEEMKEMKMQDKENTTNNCNKKVNHERKHKK